MKYNNILFERTKISKVKIYDNNFKVVKIIDNEILLERFHYFLIDIEISDLPESLYQNGKLYWDYKIDIKSLNKSDNGRWLYNKNGYLAKLNYRLKPCYKLVKIEEFNKFITEE